MFSAPDRTTDKPISSTNEGSNASTTSNAKNVPKTQSLIIDEAVPRKINVVGPTTIEYDLEGVPRPDLPSATEAKPGNEMSSNQMAGTGGIVPPGTSLPNTGPIPKPVISGDELSFQNRNTRDHVSSPTTSTHDPQMSTTQGTQPSSKYDTTTTTGKVKDTLDPNSRNRDTSNMGSGFDHHERSAASNQPGYSTRASQHGQSTGATTTPPTSAHPVRNDATSSNPSTTRTSTSGSNRHPSSSYKKSSEEEEGIVDKIKNKFRIGSSNRDRASTKSDSPTTASHISSTIDSPESKKYHSNLGIETGAGAAGAAAAYSKHETSR
jgi:hypothetical protein